MKNSIKRLSKVKMFSATNSVIEPMEERRMMSGTVVAGWTFDNLAKAAGGNSLHPLPDSGANLATATASSVGFSAFANSQYGSGSLYPTPYPNPQASDGGANNGGVGDISEILATDNGSSTGSTIGSNSGDLTANIWRLRGNNGYNSSSALGTQGAQFLTSTNGFTGINLSFDIYGTTQGEGNIQILYTTDGQTWTTVPAVDLSVNGLTTVKVVNNTTSTNSSAGYFSITGGQGWYNGLTADLSSLPVANSANFGIRIANASKGPDCVNVGGAALNNTSGNNRLDNVYIDGTPAQQTQPGVPTNPLNATVNAGATASFSSSDTGFPVPTEIWQFSTDGGATFSNVSSGSGYLNSSTYTTTATTTAQSGYEYRAAFFNTVGGPVYSSNATLTVNAVFSPTVLTNPSPKSTVTNGGNTISYSSTASGNPTPSEQWQFEPTGSTSYANVSSGGLNVSTFSFVATPSSSGSYRALFFNGLGSVNSSAASLTIYSGPTVVLSPVAATSQVPNPVTFSATLLADVNNPTITWQYQPSGSSGFTNVSSGNVAVSAGIANYNSVTGAASFTFTPTVSDQGDMFRVVISDPVGSNTSSPALLSVVGTTIASWSFNGQNGVVAPAANNPAPDVGTGMLISLGMQNDYNPATPSAGPADDILSTSGTLNTSYNENAWRVRGGSGVGVGLGAKVTEGWSSFAPQLTQGAEFQVPTTGFTDVHVHFDWYGTQSGARNGQLQYTTDGTNWVNYGSPVVSAGDDFYGSTNATTPPTGVTLDFTGNTAVNNNPNFAIRLLSVYQQDTTPTAADYLPDIYDGNPAITDANGNYVYHGQYATANKTYGAFQNQEIQIGGQGDTGYFTLSVPTPAGIETTAPIAYNSQYAITYPSNVATLDSPMGDAMAAALSALPGLAGTLVQFNDGIASNFIIQFPTAGTENGAITSAISGSTLNGQPGLTGTYFPGQNLSPSVNIIYAGKLLPYSLLGSGNWRFANILFTGSTGAPGVFSEPVGATVVLSAANPSQNVTFTAKAELQTPDISVQWQESTDGGMTFSNVSSGGTSISPIAGNPNDFTSSYVFTANNVNQTGYEFQAVFTNTDNSAASTTTAATLLVIQPTAPTIATMGQPISTTVVVGAAPSFTATAIGFPLDAVNSTTTWQQSNGTTWVNLPSAEFTNTYTTLANGYVSETSTLSFVAAIGQNGYKYQAIFGNGTGSVTASPATLTVVPVEQAVTRWSFGGNSPSGVVAAGAGVSPTAPYNGGPNTPQPDISVAPGSLTTIGFIDSNFTPPSVPAADINQTPGTLDSSYLLNTWRIRGGPSPSNPDGANVNGWDPVAPEYSQGAEIDVNATNLQNIYLSFQWFSSTQGNRDLQIQYSLNAGSGGWTNLGSPLIATPNDYYGSGPVISTPTGVVADLTGITGVSGDANLGIRLVSAYDPSLPGSQYAAAELINGVVQPLNATSGNWRFGAIQVNAVAIVPAWLSPASSSVNGGPAVWNYFTQTLTVGSGTATIIGDPALSGDSPNITVTGTGTTLNINNATGNAVNIGSLTVSGGAVVAMASTTKSNILIVPAGAAFSIGAGSKFDIGNNFLDLQESSAAQGVAELSAVTSLIQSGYSGGSWTGSGIDSSAAAGNPTHLGAVGAIENAITGTSGLYSAGNPFDRTAPGTFDVLVRYTYFGDTNLDGQTDGSDYTRIDSGFVNNQNGWSNGDVNYDGVVNGSDYTLLDNAFNTQGARIVPLTQIAKPYSVFASGIPVGASLSSSPSGISQLLTRHYEDLLGPDSDILDQLGE